MIAGFAGNVVPKGLALLQVIELPVRAEPIILGALLGTAMTIAMSRGGVVSESEARYREPLARPASPVSGAFRRAIAP